MCDSYIDYTGGSGNRYLHSIEGGRAGKRILDVVPNMTGTRNWGPVPFVICCNEAITPEYPNGDPDAMSATWSFGDNRFKLNFISDDGTIITPSEIASDDEFADFDEDEDVYEDEDEGDYDYDYEDDYEDEDFDD